MCKFRHLLYVCVGLFALYVLVNMCDITTAQAPVCEWVHLLPQEGH